MVSSVWVVTAVSGSELQVFKNKSLALSWLRNQGLKKDGEVWTWNKGEITEHEFVLGKHTIFKNEWWLEK